MHALLCCLADRKDGVQVVHELVVMAVMVAPALAVGFTLNCSPGECAMGDGYVI